MLYFLLPYAHARCFLDFSHIWQWSWYKVACESIHFSSLRAMRNGCFRRLNLIISESSDKGDQSVNRAAYIKPESE